jgi:hypothetical protein
LDGIQPSDGYLTLNGRKPVSAFPKAQAAIDVEQYLIKRLMVASLTKLAPNREIYLHLERLEDLDEVWAFCIRVPRPGWRVLGRFFRYDTFIGLRAYDRHQLAGDGYKLAAATICEDWNRILGEAPLRANSVQEYISDPIYDVSQDA